MGGHDPPIQLSLVPLQRDLAAPPHSPWAGMTRPSNFPWCRYNATWLRPLTHHGRTRPSNFPWCRYNAIWLRRAMVLAEISAVGALARFTWMLL